MWVSAFLLPGWKVQLGSAASPYLINEEATPWIDGGSTLISGISIKNCCVHPQKQSTHAVSSKVRLKWIKSSAGRKQIRDAMISHTAAQSEPKVSASSAAQCISCLDSKLKRLINQCARQLAHTHTLASYTIKNNNKRKPLINLGRCMQIEAEIWPDSIWAERCKESICWRLIDTDGICYLLNGAPGLIN